MGNSVFLKGATLIDGNGGEVVQNAGILVEGEKIVAIGEANSVKVPETAEVVDLQGKTVMPGLIDAHVHIMGGKSLNLAASALEPTEVQMGRALNDMPKLINAGFTTVRDVGSILAVHIKTLMEEGQYKGPNIQTSNQVLSQTAGHGDMHMLPPEFNTSRICDGVPDCMKAAREQFRAGADLIKICSTGGVLSEKDDPRWPQFTVDEIKAIVHEAEAVGSYVASHAQGAEGIKNALVAGVKTIEHGIYIDDEGIDLMVKQSAYLVPTLSIVKRIVERGHLHGVPEFGIRKAKRVYETHKEHMVKAYKAGVQIALGTDFAGCDPVDHGENGLELELLVKDVGMSASEAIQAGTKTAAETLGIEDTLGTIEAGKQADLLVVEGNPLEDVTTLVNTDNIKQVYVKGELLKDIS
ncbi:metal-dependent hydrolase family protein [Oceanobacillus halotolerans]|uniref:metal-dependent hydrolase family protein n=1 Tax=Oceanobacillus halotolerans TaxID=2663380 RepID=UPI0013DAE2CA|nr:amidohydrolase family protein [Oceanobacillus halotolerans]